MVQTPDTTLRSGAARPARLGEPAAPAPASVESPLLDQSSVNAAYARWAPIYDLVFGRMALVGRLFDRARDAAMAHLNTLTGDVLEVGVGTGLTLPRYRGDLRVTGIDLSPDMLARARERVAEGGLDHVVALHEMDATRLDFPDASFDVVAVMFTITVVPRPDAVMAEVERVLKPGGEAVIVSHFAAENPVRRRLETALTPLTRRLGWRPDFSADRLTRRPGLALVENRALSPFGIFSLIRLRKQG